MPASRSFEAEARVLALAWNPNGSEFAAALKNGKVQIFSIAGKLLRSWAAGDARVSTIAYEGVGRRILAGCGKSLVVLDAATGSRVTSWAAHEEDIGIIACSRDGSLLASAGAYDRVKLWKNGSLLTTLDSGPEVLGVAVSPSGDRVAAGSSDTNVRIYSGATGVLQRTLEFSMACPVLAFSPDGRMLAVGSVDGSVSITDAAGRESRRTLGRHEIPVGAAAYSSDGKHLVSTGISLNPWGANAAAKSWDLPTGKETSTSLGQSFVNAVGFAASRPIVVSARDQTLSVWDSF